jgi:4-carboxymuconolactone decarboxylase
MDEKERHALGLAKRRKVLGEAYVERARAATTPFTAEFQDLITRYAWGEIWSRPGLDSDVRRLLTIAMLIALGREGELRLHLRSALEQGTPVETVKEVILQSAIYCGVPAANAAFHLAAELVAELDGGRDG